MDDVTDAENRLSSVNGVTYTWDDNGNLLNDGTTTYGYDFANRLVSVSAASLTASYAYNGQGDLIRQIMNGQTTNFTIDMNNGLTQILSDGTSTYLYGLSRLAQDSITYGKEYFLTDALGNVRQLANASTVTLSKTYEPYGEVLSSSGTGTSSYGFTGEWTEESGLVYLRAR